MSGFPSKVTFTDKQGKAALTDPNSQLSADEINNLKKSVNDNALFHGVEQDLATLQLKHPNPPKGAFAYIGDGKGYRCFGTGWKPDVAADIEIKFQDLEDMVIGIGSGVGGKSYNTLALAQAVDPKPADNIVFQVDSDPDPAKNGVYKFLSTEPGGTFFLRSIVDAKFEDEKKSLFSGVILRKNKYLTYDSLDKKLKVVGSDASFPSDSQIFNFNYNRVNYVIRGFVGDSVGLALISGNSQIGILTTVADPANVTLSDFVFYNDATAHAGFIKLAHVTYNEAISSEVIKNYQDYLNKLRNIKNYKFFAGNLISSFYLNAIQDVKVYGAKKNEIYFIHTITNNTTGNHRLYIGKRDAVTGALDRVSVWSEASTSAKTGVETINIPEFQSSGVTADVTINWSNVTAGQNYTAYENPQKFFIALISSDVYFENISSDTQLSSGAYFLNNSVGETNFANGVQSNLKVLAFGNSFMRNSVHFLSKIAASGIGVNLTVGNLYTGGTNLQDHLTAMNNETNPYLYYEYENGVSTVSQSAQTAKRGLNSQRWDAVVLHQYTPWTQAFQPLLNKVMTKIVEILGYCPKFYINSTWAGHQDYVFEQYDFNTELEMWQYMKDAVDAACTDAGIISASIIPTGTAIQNARTLAYADTYNRFTNAQGDWHHLNSAGGFIAACAFYEKIIFPLNGVHCSDTTFRINSEVALPPSTINDSGILVTDSNYLSLCNSVIDAVTTPDQITTQ